MILVLGAGGKTGQAVIAALAFRGEAVRAFVRRPEHVEIAKQAGAQEVQIGDLGDGAALRQAMQSAEAVYHLCPNVSPAEVTFGKAVIAAAGEGRVGRLVYHSVLHPQIEAMPHHWLKLRVEEMLFEASVPFTILQPTAYMQNLLAGWKTITGEGVLRNPYPVATPLSLVDLEDVAEVAAKTLTEPGHAGATYELVGTLPLTQTQVAQTLGEALGRPVRAEAESVDSWEARARAAGLGDYQRETLIKMFRYYERHGLAGNPTTLRGLLGREPTSLAEFARWAGRERAARRRTPRYCEG